MALSREEGESMVAEMYMDGHLSLDFGFTAYATNVYLKSSRVHGVSRGAPC